MSRTVAFAVARKSHSMAPVPPRLHKALGCCRALAIAPSAMIHRAGPTTSRTRRLPTSRFRQHRPIPRRVSIRPDRQRSRSTVPVSMRRQRIGWSGQTHQSGSQLRTSGDAARRKPCATRGAFRLRLKRISRFQHCPRLCWPLRYGTDHPTDVRSSAPPVVSRDAGKFGPQRGHKSVGLRFDEWRTTRHRPKFSGDAARHRVERRWPVRLRGGRERRLGSGSLQRKQSSGGFGLAGGSVAAVCADSFDSIHPGGRTIAGNVPGGQITPPPAVFATQNRVLFRTSFQNVPACWLWLDFDANGVEGGNSACSAAPAELIRDHGGDSLFLTDSANRRAYYLSLHDGRLTSLNLDTQQQSTELFDPSQLLTYNSSTAIYAAPGGALLVTGAGFFLVP